MITTPSLRGCRIAVTGASGFIGTHLVEALLEAGASVWALNRRGEGFRHLCSRPFEFLNCDLSNMSQVRAAFAISRPVLVYHLASHRDAAETYEQASAAIQGNVALTLNCLEASRLVGARVFIYGDSAKVYGRSPLPHRAATPTEPLSSYAVTKAAGWALCDLYRRVHGLCTVSVRPTLIYGPQQKFNLFSAVIDSALKGQPIRLAGGTQTRDPLYIDDAIRAYSAAGILGPSISGQVINIGGGNEKSVAELARITVELMGSDVPVSCSPADMRPTDTERSYCDNLEASGILGWKPQVDLRIGLLRTIEAILADKRSTLPLAAATEYRSTLRIGSRLV
jgi:nucleoside-diphosphate-sugar epimerase